MHETLRTFLKIAAVCAFIGPVILLASDLLLVNAALHWGPGSFEWTIGLWVAMLLLIPAVFGLTFLLTAVGSKLAYVGGILAFFGLIAGASMQVLFRVYSVLAEQGAEPTIRQLQSTFKLVASTQMIGLPWPIGLLLLSIACFTTRTFHAAVPICLAIGGIAFPIGRIGFVYPAIILSGAAFIAAFWLIGLKLWKVGNGDELA